MKSRAAATLTNDQLIEIAPAVGSEKPIQGVSKRYSFVPTLDAVNLLRDCGWYPVAAEQSLVRKEEREGFQKHIIRFAKNGLEYNGERIDLMLYNSHDKGCAFKLIASVWRQICGNGLMVPAEFANFSHRHVGFSPEKFVESARQIAASADVIAEKIEDMKVIDLEPDERGVYALAAHQLVYDVPESAPVQPLQLLEERRYDDKGRDLWSTFNVIQENIIKGGLRGSKIGEFGRRRRVTTRGVKSIDKNIKLNKALWLLTEKMEELKRR